jgi:benzoate/toluate 1,2-dioxygenase beta subunit
MSAALADVAAQPQEFTADERTEVAAFLFEEARLADESNYDQWEALVDDDILYWVPGGMPDPDPDTTLSIIADHRARLHNRIAQLKTGKRLAQQPVSPMRRHLSNIELKRLSATETCASCNFVLHEYRAQSTHQIQIWAGRYEYRLRRAADGRMRMFYKRVDLINATGPVPSLAFLI